MLLNLEFKAVSLGFIVCKTLRVADRCGSYSEDYCGWKMNQVYVSKGSKLDVDANLIKKNDIDIAHEKKNNVIVGVHFCV